MNALTEIQKAISNEGNRLRYARLTREKTQGDMARFLQIRTSEWSAMERGRIPINEAARRLIESISNQHHCSNRLEDQCPITGSHCTGQCLNDRWATPPDHMPQTLAHAITEIYRLREAEQILREAIDFLDRHGLGRTQIRGNNP